VDVVQLVRASDCGSECRGFEPHPPPKNGRAFQPLPPKVNGGRQFAKSRTSQTVLDGYIKFDKHGAFI
jgi:hypothetical protein